MAIQNMALKRKTKWKFVKLNVNQIFMEKIIKPGESAVVTVSCKINIAHIGSRADASGSRLGVPPVSCSERYVGTQELSIN